MIIEEPSLLMKKVLFTFLVLFFASQTIAQTDSVQELTHQEVVGWLTPPSGQQTIGDGHGDIEVAKDGKVYVSVKGKPSGIQIYSADGQYQGNVPNAPADLHDFKLHTAIDGIEYIYGAQLGGQRIFKMTLDGKKLINIDARNVIPQKYKKKNKNGNYPLKFTSIAISATDELYVVDGYGSDFIHHFDAQGKYIKSFGGKRAPYKFRTCHKIIFDTRFSPERLTCADRENHRIVQMDYDGKIIAILKPKLRRPSSFAIFGEHLAIAELAGRVAILDKKGQLVATLGTNDNPKQISTPRVAPKYWQANLVTSPHGIAYDDQGNLLVTEWNKWGRVLYFKKL